jgi:purine-binding chemotaxis protein CheW
MNSSNYLIFELNGLSYALPAGMVQEILPLPELTPTDEMPPWIRGIFDLRGRFIPVLDLNQRINGTRHRCLLTDKVIVLSNGDYSPALMVSDVNNVVEIQQENIEDIRNIVPEDGNTSYNFVEGITNSGGVIVTLLSIKNILSLAETLDWKEEINENKEKKSADLLPEAQNRYFAPELTSEEREIFRGRAISLREKKVVEDSIEREPIAVIKLNNEYLGIDLKVIRGFHEIKKVSPVPCCPPHIIGQINYHGDIITLVDISPVFKIHPDRSAKRTKVIIVALNEGEVGIPVDEVEDVVYINKADISPLPTASKFVNDSFQKGAVSYLDKMLTLVDPEKILLNGNLIVHEEV